MLHAAMQCRYLLVIRAGPAGESAILGDRSLAVICYTNGLLWVCATGSSAIGVGHRSIDAVAAKCLSQE